nr:ribonuclease H-like domain-containing protein [Tanacetum cinerariifolium]
MSTQQDIYDAGSENRPPMLNKDNYVPWSSRIIRYAKSRPNGKMIVDSIKNGPYVRQMISTPREPDLPVLVPKTFHEQTDEELIENDINRMDADDQAIQTILLGLLEDVYAAVDSCKTAKEIWERVRQMMKGSDIGEQEKNAKLFNEWEKFTSTDGESIESYYHSFIQLINDLKRNKHFPENIAANLKFLNNLQPEWKRHVTIVRQTKNLYEADFTKIYDFIKMNRDDVNELRVERLTKTHDPLALMAHSQNSYSFPATHNDQSSSSTHSQQSFPINNKYNPQPTLNQNFMQPPMTSLEDISDPTKAMNVTLILFAKAFQLTTPTNNNQRTLSNPRNRQIAQPVAQNQQGYNAWQNGGIQVAQNAAQNPEEFDFMAAVGDLDEIEEHASTSGTQLGKAPVYDTDGSAKVQLNENCYDNDIFNMFTQEEQYMDLLEPIPKPQLVPQNGNHVIYIAPSMMQSGGTVETSSAPNEETRAHQELVYRNLIDQVAQLRAWLFENTSESINNTSRTSVTPQVDKPKLIAVTPYPKKLHASIPLHSVPQPREFNVVKHSNVIAPGIFKIDPSQTSRVDLVPNNQLLVHTARTRRPQLKGNTRNDRVPSVSKSSEAKKNVTVEDHRCPNFLWCVDSCCSKHMIGNIKLLINFIWKFLGTVRFRNDHIAIILGYGDLKWGNITITSVYFVEGLGYNLFSVGHFCDADLEVAFRRNTCFIRDLDGVDLLKGNRTTNLYTINLYDMASASPICLMAVPLLLSRGYGINDYPTSTLTPSTTLPKMISSLYYPSLNMLKNIFAPLVSKEKAKELSPTQTCSEFKAAASSASYVFITKDETPEVIKNFLKNISVCLQAPVIIVRTNNETEFKNHALKEYFDSVGITHETSAAKTPQQNGVVERRNHTLVEAARTIKPDISYLHVFGALCYPKNDHEDIDKLGAKGDIGFFIGYSANSVAYRVYNRRTKKIMEMMNVTFDELSKMTFEQNSSKPGLQSLTPGQISFGLELTYALSTITPQKPSERDLDILFEPFHKEYFGGQPSEASRTVLAAPVIHNLQAPTASMAIQDSAPTPTNSSNTPNSSHNVDEKSQKHAQQQGNHTSLPTASAADNVPNAMFEGDLFVNPFATPSTEYDVSSTQYVDPSNMHTFY